MVSHFASLLPIRVLFSDFFSLSFTTATVANLINSTGDGGGGGGVVCAGAHSEWPQCSLVALMPLFMASSSTSQLEMEKKEHRTAVHQAGCSD